jgi:hypothetical protein
MCKIAVFFKDSFLALLPGSLGFTTNMGGTAAGISGTLQGLQNFRDITAVQVGNGHLTAFWLDLWCGDYTLAERFPALFSHSQRINIC